MVFKLLRAILIYQLINWKTGALRFTLLAQERPNLTTMNWRNWKTKTFSLFPKQGSYLTWLTKWPSQYAQVSKTIECRVGRVVSNRLRVSIPSRARGVPPSPKYLQRCSIIMKFASWEKPSKFFVLATYILFLREPDIFCAHPLSPPPPPQVSPKVFTQ